MTGASGRRIAVSGPPADTAAILAALETSIGPVIASPPHRSSSRGGPWPAIENALHRFEYRVDHESRHRAFVSHGSVLQDWAELHLALHGGDRRGRDITFAERYTDMFATTVTRHARVTYSLHIVVGSPGDTLFGGEPLSTAIRAAGIPLVSAPDAGSVLQIIDGMQLDAVAKAPA